MQKNKAEKWLALCEAGAQIFSTCGKRQYYAVVLSPSGRVVGTGYNGSPPGMTHCVDGGCPRLAANSPSGSSYENCVANHAEQNAIMWSDRFAREGGTLIVNGTPCWECSKLIAGSGISTVVHTEDPAYADWSKCRELLESVGIHVVTLAANSDDAGHDSCPIRFGPEQSLDLASRAGNGGPLADRYFGDWTLGDDSLDSSDDWAYDVELEDEHEWLEGEY